MYSILEGSVEGKPLVVLQILTRGGAVAARVAHNHEVRGSSPLPATMMLMFKAPVVLQGY
jgi:hypothetical protein